MKDFFSENLGQKCECILYVAKQGYNKPIQITRNSFNSEFSDDKY